MGVAHTDLTLLSYCGFGQLFLIRKSMCDSFNEHDLFGHLFSYYVFYLLDFIIIFLFFVYKMYEYIDVSW